MAGRAAPIAIDPSNARRCRILRQREQERSRAPAATDRLAPTRRATRLGAPLRPLPDAKIVGGEVNTAPLQMSARRHTFIPPCLAHHAADALGISRLLFEIQRIDTTTGDKPAR